LVPERVDEWFTEMRKGYARLIILSLLAEKPKHGYELMKTMEDVFLGWSPSTSAIYPILHDMEQKGYVSSELKTHGKRETKVYDITEKGESSLRKSVEKQAQFGQQLETVFREYASEVLGLDDIESLPDMGFLEHGIDKLMELEDLNREEKMTRLTQRREHLRQLKERLDEMLTNIEGRLNKLKRETPQES
jgi:DNA-binding PadR family transcriptional regulator